MGPPGPALRRFPSWSLVGVGTLVLVASLSWSPLFDLTATRGALTAASVVPVLLAALVGRWRPARLEVTLVLSVALYLWLAHLLVIDGPGPVPTATTLRLIGEAGRTGRESLVDDPLPLTSATALLVAFTLTWVSAAVSAELVLRGRGRLAPLLPATALLTLGLWLGTAGDEHATATTTVLFVVVAGAVLATRRPGRPAWAPWSGRTRRSTTTPASDGRGPVLVATAVGVVLVVTVAATLGASVVTTDRTPVVAAREVSRTELDVRDNPLTATVRRLTAPDRPMFTVEADDPAIPFWRLVDLPRFDGDAWLPDADYIATDEIPADPSVDVDGTAVDQRFRIQGLEGPWVPAADRPASTTGDLLADPVSASLVSTQVPLRGLGYDVRSTVVAADDLDAGARVSTGDRWRAFRELPVPSDQARLVVADLRERAATLTLDAPGDLGRARAIETFLRTNFALDPRVPTGHGYGRLVSIDESFLAERRGSTEQFASAFALLARAAGLPTRVAVGFRRGTVDASGVEEVRGADAHAWAEVHFDGAGWVAFDPTPAAAAGDGSSTTTPSTPTTATTTPTSATTATVPPQSVTTTDRPAGTAQGEEVPSLALGAGALVVLVVVAAVGWSNRARLRRAARRRRRRVGPEASRVVGAYLEAIDDLEAAGLGPLGARSPREVAELTEAAFGPGVRDCFLTLAGLTDVVVFGGAPPQPGVGDQAWQAYDALAAALDAHRRTRGQPVGGRSELERSGARVGVRRGDPGDTPTGADEQDGLPTPH